MSDLGRSSGPPQRAPEDPWWDYTHGCAQALRQGREPPAHPVHGLLLEPGETVRNHASVQYSRLEPGRTAQPGARAPVMAYNPVMMMGSMAVQGIADARRNRQASQQSQPEWRLTRPASVLTTDQRVMCNRPDGGWLSFWYQDLSEHHIDLSTRTLVMAFDQDQCAPVRLQGPAMPAIALWSSVGIYGDAWKDDPRLSALSTPSPAQQQRQRETNARNSTHDLNDEDRQWAQEQARRYARAQQSRSTASGREL